MPPSSDQRQCSFTPEIGEQLMGSMSPFFCTLHSANNSMAIRGTYLALSHVGV